MNCRLVCVYEKALDPTVTEERSFKTKNEIVLTSTNIDELYIYTRTKDKLLPESTEFEHKESDWVLKEIIYLEIRLNKYNPLRGSKHIVLPHFIQNKKAVENVQNDENKCFQWAVFSALHSNITNQYRSSCYAEFANELDFTGIEFPVKLNDIPKFQLTYHHLALLRCRKSSIISS